MELRLWNGEDRVVFLQPVRVDRDAVPLWRLSNVDGTDTVEEIDGGLWIVSPDIFAYSM
jgi:hypothetical protein